MVPRCKAFCDSGSPYVHELPGSTLYSVHTGPGGEKRKVSWESEFPRLPQANYRRCSQQVSLASFLNNCCK